MAHTRERFDLGCEMEGFKYQKERHIFKDFSYEEGHLVMLEHNEGGKEKKSFE